MEKFKKNIGLHLMLLPAVVLLFVFNYIPMGGVVIAFQDFIPAKGLFGSQEWVGLKNFELVFNNPYTARVINNTVVISVWKIVLGSVVPLVFSVFLNEITQSKIKKSIQTAIYLPYFISWVLVSGIFIDILSPSNGIVNQLLQNFGLEPVFFLGDPKWFRFTVILTDIWKTFGWSTIVYLAAISGIDPQLYEATSIDGGGRFRKMLHVTIPGMASIIVLLAVLSIGNILNAGFDQIFNMYNANVYETGDVLDTFVYRMGILDGQFGVSTAVGLFKSVISTVFVSLSYFLAYKLAGYRIF